METVAFGKIMDRWTSDADFVIKGLTTDKNKAILTKVSNR